MAQSHTSTQILDVAQELVQTRGFNAFSYADISEVVGIRKASIHYHFATKAQLGQALAKRYREEFASALEQIRETTSDRYKQLAELVKIYEEDLKKDRLCLCGMLSTDILTLPPEIRDEVKAFIAATETWIQESIQGGCEAGSLACDKPEMVAKMLLAALTGTQLIARASQWEPEQFARTIESQLAGLKA